MYAKNITIGGVSFNDYFKNNLAIQNMQYDGNIETKIIKNENWHGGIISPAIGSNRLFTFTGRIFPGNGHSGDGIKLLQDLLNLWEGYVEITWEDKINRKFKTMAKTYSLPSMRGIVNGYIYDFTFEMISNTFEYLGYEDKVVRGTMGEYENYFGGEVFPLSLPNNLGTYKGLEVLNNGNHPADCRIEIIGEVINPIIINGDTGRSYKLNYTTNNLVLDNRGKEFILTDVGIDIKQYRKPGSVGIYLKPGINNIVLLGENNIDGVRVNIFYNDTYK